jgi:5-methylcytosine-specific restriction endonuclease McrA
VYIKMPKKKVILSDKFVFESQTECQNYTRSLIKQIGLGVVPPEHHEYFMCIYKNHSKEDALKKPSCNEISHFKIVNRVLGNRPDEIKAVHIRGHDIPFSWVNCSKDNSNVDTKKSQKIHLTEACRSAILCDVNAFNASYDAIDRVCAKCESVEALSVDHKTTPFSTIFTDFMEGELDEIPTKFDFDRKCNTAIFKRDDDEFKERWILYHRSRATYQLLCKPCNSSKGKRSNAEFLAREVKKKPVRRFLKPNI